MPSMTAADAASSTTKRKGWVDMTDAEEQRVEAQDARESAAEKTGRKGRDAAEPLSQMNSPMKRAESPLYRKD